MLSLKSLGKTNSKKNFSSTGRKKKKKNQTKPNTTQHNKTNRVARVGMEEVIGGREVRELTLRFRETRLLRLQMLLDNDVMPLLDKSSVVRPVQLASSSETISRLLKDSVLERRPRFEHGVKKTKAKQSKAKELQG